MFEHVNDIGTTIGEVDALVITKGKP